MRHSRQSYADIQIENGSLVFRSSYDAGLVAAFKGSIPNTERKWDPNRKVWIVAPQHGKLLSGLCAQYLGVDVQEPRVQAIAQEEIRVLDVRYVGATKARDGSEERTAFGFAGGSWSVIFPESALVFWFTGMKNRAEAATFYGTLGVVRSAAQDDIKTAFRRLAREWHPDTSKEPDAAEMFIKIKAAYDALSDPQKRARYDAGLALEATLQQETRQINDSYRSPRRCGYVQALGVEQVGRFLVKQIYGWEDITNVQGQTLVASWPFGANNFTEEWV